MFTGIISERGTVTEASFDDSILTVTFDAPETAESLTVGDSVAINGVCLTAVSVTSSTFTVEIVGESIRRTTLVGLGEGSSVNLERPMMADGRFDGHIVQGHVDGVGRLQSKTPEGSAVCLRFSLPAGLTRYIVEKGSVTLDGVSLTITAVSNIDARETWLEVVVIPHTNDVTGLGTLESGSPVNIEVDVIAKYVERMTGGKT